MKAMRSKVQKSNTEQNKNNTVKNSNRKQANEIDVTPNVRADGKTLTVAMEQKSVLRDIKRNRTLLITENSVIEMDDKIKTVFTMSCRDLCNKLMRDYQNGDYTVEEIADVLTIFEYNNAGFLDTDGFREAKRKLFEFVAKIRKSLNPKVRKDVDDALKQFLQKSKANIFQGKRTFKNIGYTINNTEEKEFLRHMFIAELVKARVMDYKFLLENGVVSEMDETVLDELYKDERLLTLDDLDRAYIEAGICESKDEVMARYAKKDRKFFLEIASIEDIAKLIISGKVAPKDVLKRLRIDEVKTLEPELLEDLLCVSTFPKGTDFLDFANTGYGTEKYLYSDFLLALDRDSFMKVILSEKIKYKNMLISDDYIDLYGTLNSDDIFLLQQKGLVGDEDLLRLTTYLSVRENNPDEFSHMLELQMDYYNVSKLEELYKSNKMNLRFADTFNKFLENVLIPEQREEYIEKLKTELESKENGEEITAILSQKGINVTGFGKQISLDTISDLYIEESVDEAGMIKLYQSGLLAPEVIISVFSAEELIESYENGKIDYRVLNFIENRKTVIKNELQSGKLTVPQLMELYSQDTGIEIEEFLGIVKDKTIEEESLVDYLSDNISEEKVEGLFTNYYISQDDLSILVARNVISKEVAEKLAEQIATDQEYESIFKDTTGVIVLTEDTEPGESITKGLPVGPRNSRASQLKIDPELQELLLDEIEFDSRRPVLQGANNSLDGYTLYPSKKMGVMVFLKPDKPGNATYIMSLQQGLYFLKKIIRDSKINQSQEVTKVASDATKRALRETEFVKVKNASAGWGKNIVDSIRVLSPEFRQRMKEDYEYRKSINDVVSEIRTDYIERKRESEEK